MITVWIELLFRTVDTIYCTHPSQSSSLNFFFQKGPHSHTSRQEKDPFVRVTEIFHSNSLEVRLSSKKVLLQRLEISGFCSAPYPPPIPHPYVLFVYPLFLSRLPILIFLLFIHQQQQQFPLHESAMINDTSVWKGGGRGSTIRNKCNGL